MAISIQIFVYSLVCNRIFLRYSNVQSLAPKKVFRFFPKMLGDHNYELTLIIIDNSMSQFRQGNNLRLNAIIKDDQTIKVSIVANPRTTIAKLKRQIQQQLLELFSINLLVSVIEDSRGFVLSNNSTISEHCGNNQTVYLQIHKEKLGSNMNLPNNATDIFMTLRYVCSSVIKKLENLEISLDPIQVLPEILHIGFWYSNTEIVTSLCRFLNKILTTESIEQFYKKAHDIHNALLLKLFTFWFSEVRNSFAVFPDVGEELLSLLYKLSLNPNYAQLMRGSKILANIIELSKDQLISPQMKKASILTIKNINGKGLGMKTTSAYIPSALQQSNAYLSNIEQVLDKLSSSNQEQMASALTQLSQHPKLVAEACVRFDYFMKLCLIFNIKSVKDKTSIRAFNAVVKQIMSNITKQKAKEIMQKDIIRKLHNFLLESHPQAHPIVLEFYSIIAKESTTKGVFNIEQANEVLLTPYPQFQKITIESLSEMSEKQKQTSSIRFLPSIKDYIRLSLKTDSDSLSAGLIKILSNLTLDQQCRYQIINLKGIQIFVKLLEIGDKNGRSQLQRSCAKGLLNLSLSSRQTKAKILAQMTNVLQRFYKGSLDGVAGSYVQTLLKSNKV